MLLREISFNGRRAESCGRRSSSTAAASGTQSLKRSSVTGISSSTAPISGTFVASNSSSAKPEMDQVLQFLHEQETAKLLLRLDTKYRMRDGAPRVLFWTAATKAPCNHEAFQTLSLRRVDTEASRVAMAEVKELLKFQRDERAAARLWGGLTVHEAKLSAVPFVPYLCVAICRGIPTNPIAALEVALHLLRNLCREWIEEFPRPPMGTLRRLDEHLQRHAKLGSLWEFLNDGHIEGGCTLLDYLWVPLQTFYLLNFPQDAWVAAFDDVICRPDGTNLFSGVAIALLWQLQDALLTCETREQVLAVLATSIDEPRARQQLLSRAGKVAAELVLRPGPVEYLPARGDYYPLLYVGSRPLVPERVDKRSKLQEMEVEQQHLERRLKVELSTLSMSAEVKRFHDTLAELRTGGDTSSAAVPSGSGTAAYQHPWLRKADANGSPRQQSADDSDAGAARSYPGVATAASADGGRSGGVPVTARVCSLVMEGSAVPMSVSQPTPTEDNATAVHKTMSSKLGNAVAESLSPGLGGEVEPDDVPVSVRQAVAVLLASDVLQKRRSQSRDEGVTGTERALSLVRVDSEEASPLRGKLAPHSDAGWIPGSVVESSLGYNTSTGMQAASRGTSALPK